MNDANQKTNEQRVHTPTTRRLLCVAMYLCFVLGALILSLPKLFPNALQSFGNILFFAGGVLWLGIGTTLKTNKTIDENVQIRKRFSVKLGAYYALLALLFGLSLGGRNNPLVIVRSCSIALDQILTTYPGIAILIAAILITLPATIIAWQYD